MLAGTWWARIVEDGMGEAYVFATDTCQFKLVNRQARENLGYDAAELIALTPWDIKPDISKPVFLEIIAPLVSGEESMLMFETRHQRKDGSRYDVSVRLQLLRSGADAVFFAAIEDITARRLAENQLRETTDRLDAIVNNTRMALFMMDEHQRCIFMNTAAEAMTGFTFAETQGRVLHDVIHHSYPDGRHFPLSDCAIDRVFPEENQQSGEEVFVRKDGSFYPVGFTASPMRDASGKTIGTVIEVRLIAEEIQARETIQAYNSTLEREIEVAIAQRKQAEVQLVQAQKMEAIGNLTGGIAHDFNNILQVIRGNLDLMSRDITGLEAAERRLEYAQAGVERGSKLTSQLLAFGRRQPLEPSPLHLGRLLQGLGDMLRRTLGEAVEIEITASSGLWNCEIDRSQIENAILNLAINARDAMNNRGKLTFEVSNAVLDDQYAADHSEVSAGQYVMLAVTDTGSGMAPETLAKVFEPFFSTKPEGEGTGLGLSMVYGFITQSGGHIKLYSEIGEGTTVRLYLPRTRRAEDCETRQPLREVHGGSETILIVEDDDAVRATAVEMLTDLGYRVLKAANAANALAIAHSGVAIDLLFTDVVMPGTVRSTELARMTVAAHPHVGVLFASGYTQNTIVHAGKLDDGVELLSKPYGRDNLARKIRQVLDRRPVPTTQPGPMPPISDARALRILAVEDEAMIRMVLVDMLLDMGHEVAEAEGVAEARMLLATSDFDVLVADGKLQDGSGIDLALEATSQKPSLAVIIASGLANRAAAWPASWLALPKPYTEATLKLAIEQISRV